MGRSSATDASEAKNRIIQALIFSSNSSTLPSTHHLFFKFSSEFGINHCHACYLAHLVHSTAASGTDHRTMEALKHLPQSKLSWSSDLATAMKLVFGLLLCQSWKAPFYFVNQHAQWLGHTKPWKHGSMGSPKLSSRFYSYGRKSGWSKPITKFDYDLPYHHNFSPARGPFYPNLCDKEARIMCNQGYDCILLLKAVISFLRQADLTSEVARLARKSLPKATLWFPKLMKRARIEMNRYVLRWEGS